MSALTEYREGKDSFFRAHPDSPLPQALRGHFSGLSYFDENPALALILAPEPPEDETPAEMQTSTGDVTTYLRHARVAFDIDGQSARLTIFRSVDDDDAEYFLPFSDTTSAHETYGGGRYLDVHPLPDGRMMVDFNYAYNPFCAYSDDWSCPFPPAENRLAVPVRAGEKTFHTHAD